MSDLTDFQNFGRKLQRELDKLDRHHPRDQPYVKQFVSKMDGRVAESSLQNYLNYLRYPRQALDDEKAIVDLSEVEFDELVYDLRTNPAYGRGSDSGYSNNTVRNFQFVIRKFLTFVDVPGTEWADDYVLLPAEDSNVRPEDMLHGEDINALTAAANNLRDVALIEFLADTGARLSLVGSLRVGDVSIDDDKATYTPNPNATGLKGADIMPYPIIDSRAPLFSYLNTMHPRPDRDDVALFHKLAGHGNSWEDGDGSLSPHAIRESLQRAAKNAGVEKPVNPHNFRHSAITRMARENYTRSEIEHRVHWTIDTKMWATYQHISGAEHNDAIWEKAGVAESEDARSSERRPCGNCLETLAPHHEFCPRCGSPASERARDIQESVESEGIAALSEADLSPLERRVVAAALEHVRQDADVTPDHD